MKIGLDMRMLGGGSGISRYIQQLTLKLLAQDKTNSYVLFFNSLTPELDKLYRPFGHEMVATGIGHYSFAEQFSFPKILNRHKLDLVHFPHFNVPLLYRKPFVVTIHDLTHTRFPGRKKSRFIYRIAYHMILLNAVSVAKQIIAVSETTKAEIIRYFRVPAEKIKVVYEAAADNYAMTNKAEAFNLIKEKFSITKPFILYVGVWRRYKNLPKFAQAFDRIAEKLDYEWVLAGEPDAYYPEIKEQIFSIKNSGKVKTVGRVTESDLISLYNAAELVVLPSLYEGFGLTMLEAASCGTAVAASDIPVTREVMGYAAEYFDPENVDNMSDVIATLLANPVRVEELANAGLRRVKHFSWDKAAAETVGVYNNLGKT
jgi:glycosyltransferase involved in cell wall biosynthesis